MARREVALAGGAMSALTKLRALDSFELVRCVVEEALRDAGIPRGEVRSLAVTPPGLAGHSTAMFVSRLAAYLGLPLRSLACLENGGTSGALALRWAMHEVRSGRCPVAVAAGADQRLDTRAEPGETVEAFIDRNVHTTVAVYGPYDGPYGLGAPIPYYAMSAQRYMAETGATPTDLAWAAVRLREHAQGHERAMFRGRTLTVEEVLASEMVCPPLHLADCSQFVSGAAAVVVVAPEVARALNRPPVWLRGLGEYHHPSSFSAGAVDLASFPSVREAAREAYADAGVGPRDLDVAEVYGVFSSTELILCEDLGLFPRGRSGAAFREGRASRGGEVVVDPSGGRLSLGHPACATPLLETLEVLLQLQGRAGARQVPGARLGLVHAEHGMLNGSMVSIWERDA
ncbi:MAG: thiolase family protein [Planctomycetes bacterium]|nr:thiolase family protein [Planctomycetota bacterium]